MTLRLDVAFSLQTYNWALEKLNLGEPHPTLVGGLRWYPDDERLEYVNRSKSELREAGLLEQSTDRFTNLGEDVFHVMQNAEVEYYTYATINKTAVCVRGAALGTDALLIISGNNRIEVEGIDADQVASRVAAALPDTPPARIHSLTTDFALLEKLSNGDRIAGGNANADAKRMLQFLALDQRAMGDLHVRIRPSHGAKPIKYPPRLPLWVDTDEGRGLFDVKDGWASLRPAGARELADKFAEMERTLQTTS